MDTTDIRTAIQQGRLDLVQQHIQEGRPIPDDALYIAVVNGNNDIAHALLDARAYVNEIESRELYEAVEQGNFDLARVLLDRGAGLGQNSRFLLERAASGANVDFVVYLLAIYARDAGFDWSNDIIRDMTELAEFANNEDVLAFLQEHEQDLLQNQDQVLAFLQEQIPGQQLQQRPEPEIPPPAPPRLPRVGHAGVLMSVVRGGSLEVLEAVLQDREWPIQAKNEALIEAARHYDAEKTIALLNAGADPDTHDGSALYTAARFDAQNVLRVLLSWRGDRVGVERASEAARTNDVRRALLFYGKTRGMDPPFPFVFRRGLAGGAVTVLRSAYKRRDLGLRTILNVLSFMNQYWYTPLY